MVLHWVYQELYFGACIDIWRLAVELSQLFLELVIFVLDKAK